MPTKALEFLSIAKSIKGLKNESAYRASISRSYYACFHYSYEMASILDDADGKGMHVRHINKFINSQNRKVKSIGYQLRQFHDMRVEADYELSMFFDEAKANLAIMMAERIIEDIDKNS